MALKFSWVVIFPNGPGQISNLIFYVIYLCVMNVYNIVTHFNMSYRLNVPTLAL